MVNDDENKEGGLVVVVLVVVLDGNEMGGGDFNPPACEAWTTRILGIIKSNISIVIIIVATVKTRVISTPFFICLLLFFLVRVCVCVRVRVVGGKNVILDIQYLPVVSILFVLCFFLSELSKLDSALLLLWGYGS